MPPIDRGRQGGYYTDMKRFNQHRPGHGRPASKTSWEGVADWYGGHLSESDSLLQTLVYPGVLKLLAPVRGKEYLDIACGEGSFGRLLAKSGVRVSGFDASPSLIERAVRLAPTGSNFRVADAARFAHLFPPAGFSGAVCLLAIQNINPVAPVFYEASKSLAAGATLVIVMNHPCFRIPRQSSWGWEEERKMQYRRIDSYMSEMKIPIVAHPGERRSIKTMSYHRPLSAYINALGKAGFAVDALEEWVSNRLSDSGPRAKAENRIRAEIPMFLAIRAVKIR